MCTKSSVKNVSIVKVIGMVDRPGFLLRCFFRLRLRLLLRLRVRLGLGLRSFHGRRFGLPCPCTST